MCLPGDYISQEAIKYYYWFINIKTLNRLQQIPKCPTKTLMKTILKALTKSTVSILNPRSKQ